MTAGGRVLTVTAVGDSLDQTVERAYRAPAGDVPPQAGPDRGSFGLVLVDVGSPASTVTLSDVLVQDLGPWSRPRTRPSQPSCV